MNKDKFVLGASLVLCLSAIALCLMRVQVNVVMPDATVEEVAE